MIDALTPSGSVGREGSVVGSVSEDDVGSIGLTSEEGGTAPPTSGSEKGPRRVGRVARDDTQAALMALCQDSIKNISGRYKKTKNGIQSLQYLRSLQTHIATLVKDGKGWTTEALKTESLKRLDSVEAQINKLKEEKVLTDDVAMEWRNEVDELRNKIDKAETSEAVNDLLYNYSVKSGDKASLLIGHCMQVMSTIRQYMVDLLKRAWEPIRAVGDCSSKIAGNCRIS